MPLWKSAAASGDASADSPSAKSRVPASITVWPGKNLRVAGLGVCSVWISMAGMWSRDQFQSRTKRRRAGDDPAAAREGSDEAEQGQPPFAGPHRLDAGIECRLARDHRPGQLPPAQAVEG